MHPFGAAQFTCIEGQLFGFRSGQLALAMPAEDRAQLGQPVLHGVNAKPTVDARGVESGKPQEPAIAIEPSTRPTRGRGSDEH